ncbi:MAG TPA: hypothetical protein VJM50_23835 [Pyrinomonadaceae bacterium]|nr:hypothetical protein [Pyrinomonadaceae bacterium]
MPSPRWERLDDFLSLDDFAIEAIFIPAGGQARPAVAVIFDDPYFDGNLGEYVQDSSVPRFWTKEANVAGIKKHDDCTFPDIPGVVFSVLHDPRPDGTGGATVELERFTDDQQ